jgi:formylglycine-generating enzyme required for sulfatase activity
MAAAPVRLTEPSWWTYLPGADWRHPGGPGTSISGRGNHPVVHVAYADAAAYAAFVDARLPTEAEWEWAALGGGWVNSELEPPERVNVWRGEFPWRHESEPGTTAVGSFGPDGAGRSDMIGNVWEWTSDWYQPRHSGSVPCCGGVRNPRGPESAMTDPALPTVPMRVAKGGSFLCAANYCARYRASARLGQAIDTSSCHIGFRLARSQ